jgi:hypothetical protein
MKSLFPRLRNISMAPPSVEVVVEHKVRQNLHTGFGGGGRDTIELRMA